MSSGRFLLALTERQLSNHSVKAWTGGATSSGKESPASRQPPRRLHVLSAGAEKSRRSLTAGFTCIQSSRLAAGSATHVLTLFAFKRSPGHKAKPVLARRSLAPVIPAASYAPSNWARERTFNVAPG
eukprot:TRINITY_DN36788_c0_g1_i3.p1 TRINITY_DN36788_c0_g1~~TRINITY_DN36788_c0_g1_i3.p1  ORF type:complete len:127 (+),score=12.97 TRINITY_DN36788_c0_g1_i3:163-543(+)